MQKRHCKPCYFPLISSGFTPETLPFCQYFPDVSLISFILFSISREAFF